MTKIKPEIFPVRDFADLRAVARYGKLIHVRQDMAKYGRRGKVWQNTAGAASQGKIWPITVRTTKD